MADLSGKSAVVLGATSPHGAATARVLAREGVALALGGRDREKLEALGKAIVGAGGQAIVVGTDLVKRHHLAHLAEAAAEEFGGPDFLLIMAHASAAPLGSLEVESWERSVDVNIKGFLYSVAAVLPYMREKGGGHIISIDACDTATSDSLYEAGRAAIRVLLREMAGELSGEGVRASEVGLTEQQRVEPDQCAEAVRRVLVASG